MALWGDGDSGDGWDDDEGGGPPQSRTEMLAAVNRMRRRKGLPPVEPQGWVPDPGVDWRGDAVAVGTETAEVDDS